MAHIVGYMYKAEIYTPLGMKEHLLREGIVHRTEFEPERIIGGLRFRLAEPSIANVIATALHRAGVDMDAPETYDSDAYPKPVFDDETTDEEMAEFIGRPQVIARWAGTAAVGFSFDDVATSQGWDQTSRLVVVENFIHSKGLADELARFAHDVANEENTGASS